MNHFMARLIFCFFAESTDIFLGDNLFTATVEQMSARDSSNTHEVIGAVFRAMSTKGEERACARVPRWTDAFAYGATCRRRGPGCGVQAPVTTACATPSSG